MKGEDPRGKRDPILGDLLREAVAVPALPADFGEQIQAHLGEIDAQAGKAGVTHAPRRDRRRWALVAIAGVAALAMTLVVAGRHSVRDYTQPQPASAAEVVARVRECLPGSPRFRRRSRPTRPISRVLLSRPPGPVVDQRRVLRQATCQRTPQAQGAPSQLIATSEGQARLTSPVPEDMAPANGKLTLEPDCPAERSKRRTTLPVPSACTCPRTRSRAAAIRTSGVGEIAVEAVNTPIGPPDARRHHRPGPPCMRPRECAVASGQRNGRRRPPTTVDPPSWWPPT